MPQAVVAALVKIGTLIVGSLNAAYLGYKTVAIIGAVTVAGSVAAAKRLFAIELPKVDTDGSRQRTVKSTTEAQKVIYGEALVSGPISYIGLKGTDNKDLYQVISLAGHEVNAITDVHFDSQVIANASIGGGSANGGAVSGIFSGYATINKHLGLTTETADSLLTAAFGPGTGTPTASQYTSNHRGDGIAYLAMKWTLDDDSAELWEKYSPQNVKALVQGKKVYDPRLDSTAGANPENTSYIVYQTNPVNCLIDYLMDDNYGMGIPADKINWPAAVTAANGCDVTVNVPGGTESRFTCNGVIFATDSHKKNIAKILSSMNGTLVYTNGKYVIKSGIYYNHSADLNEDDLTGAITVKTSFEGSDRFNTIKGLFIDPSQNHKSSEFPKVQLTDAVSRDNNKVLEKEIALNMTNTSYMAQRIANKLIQQSSQQQIINFPANLSAMRIAVGDRVRVTVSDLSWSNKIFECIGWTFSDDGGINLTLREDSDQAYDDPDPSENEYSTISATGDITDAFRGVPSPSGLTATPGLKSNELNWVNPLRPADYGTIYVYASRNANFSSAVKIGETDGTQFIHDSSNKSLIFSPSVVNVGDTYTIRTIGNTDFTAMGAASNTVGVVFTATATGSGTGNLWETIVPGNTRYYWVRAIKNVGTDAASRSDLEPNSDPNTTVFATVGAVEVDWDNVADPTIGIDINNDTISINTGSATTTTGQDVATSGIEAGTTVTQGGITMNQGGSIKGGQSGYNTGTGFFLGYDSSAYKFSIGNSSGEALTFDGTNLAVTGDITATSGTFTGSVSVSNTGSMYGGTMSSFNTGAGFFLGYDTDAYKLSVGDSSGEVLTWDGSKLNVDANTVSFATGGEQDYSSESRYTTSQKSATVVLANNSSYFLFDNRRQDLAFPDFVVSYYLGPLTSGTQSSQANARNGIMDSIQVELFYADASTGSPGTWTSFRSITADSWYTDTGTNYVFSNFRVKDSGSYVASLDTRNGILDDYPTMSPFGDDLDGTSVPVGLVDNDYFINIPISRNTVVFPKGRYFIKVVITVTDGSLSPYPSTGSPTATERRVSIPNASSFVHPDFGQAVFVGGAHTTIFTDNNRDNETLIKGGSVYLMSKEGANAADSDSTAIFFGGRGTTGGTPNSAYGPLHGLYFFNDRDSIGSGSGILGSIGNPNFAMYVPYDGSKLTFDGDANFLDGLYINGVAVNAGAVTGPAGSDTQIQYNDGGSLAASANLTFNDSTNTLTVQNLTVSGTTTTVNTDNLTVKDPNIVLNYSTGDSSSTANNAGITIQDAVDATTDASLLWKTATDTFELSHAVTWPSGSSTNANTAYTYSQVGHLPLTGGTLTGGLSGTTGSFSSDVSITGDLKFTGTDSYIWSPNTTDGFAGFYDPNSNAVVAKYENNTGGWGFLGAPETGFAFKVYGSARITDNLRVDDLLSVGHGNFSAGSVVDARITTDADSVMRLWNYNTGSSAVAAIRVASSGSGAEARRFELTDNAGYLTTLASDNTNGFRLRHGASNSGGPLANPIRFRIANDGNAFFTEQLRVRSLTHLPFSSLFEGTLVIEASADEDPIIVKTDSGTAGASAGVFHQASSAPTFPAFVVNTAASSGTNKLVSLRTSVSNSTGTGGTEKFSVDNDGRTWSYNTVIVGDITTLNTGFVSSDETDAFILADGTKERQYILTDSNNGSAWHQWVRYRNGVNTWRIGTLDTGVQTGFSAWRLAGTNRNGGEINYIVAGPRAGNTTGTGWTDRIVLYEPYARYGSDTSYLGSGSLYKILSTNTSGESAITFTHTSTMDLNLVANPPELNFEDTSSTTGTKRARWTLDSNKFSAQALSDNDGAVTQQLVDFTLSDGLASFGGAISITGGFTQDANGSVNSIRIHDDDNYAQPGLYITNTLTSATKEFYVKTYGPSVNLTIFGQGSANKSVVLTSGSTDAGLSIGTYGAAPVIIGTNNAAKISIPATGSINFHSQNLTGVGTISSGAITATGSVTSAGVTSNSPVIITSSTDAKLVLKETTTGTVPWNYMEFRNSDNDRNAYIGTNNSNQINIVGDTGVSFLYTNLNFLSGAITSTGQSFFGNQSGIKGTSTNPTSNVAYLTFYESDGTTRQGYVGYGSGGNQHLYINNDLGGDILLNTSSTNRVTIKDNGLVQQTLAGNVADGTYYSGYTMNVTGTSTFGGIRFDRAGTAMYRVGLRNDDKFQIANFSLAGVVDNQFVITTDGKVGIQDGSPAQALSVTGNITASDSISVESGGIRIGDGFGSGGSATIHRYQADLYLQYNNGQAGNSTTVRFGGNGIACGIYDETNASYYLNSNSNKSYVAANGQFFGIGTNNPGVQLDIVNASHAVARLYAGTNSSASLRLRNDAQDWDVNLQTNDKFAVYDHTSGNQSFTILPTSNFVGINNDNPSYMLDVKGPATIAEPYGIIRAQAAGLYGGFIADAPNQAHIRFAIGGNMKWQWRTGSTTSGDLRAYSWDGGADQFQLTTAGYLTLGNGITLGGNLSMSGQKQEFTYTGGPSLFDQTANTSSVGFRMNKAGNYSSTSRSYGVLNLSRTNGTTANGNGAGLYFMLKADGNALQEYAGIAGVRSGNTSGELDFMSYGRNVQMRMDQSGNFTCAGNVTAYSDPSDRKLKDNIEIIPNAIKKVQALNGVTFNYKKDGKRSTGLIAQDVQEVLPEAVYESKSLDGEEFLALNYGNTVGLLVEAIKEQQKQIEDLKQTIEELKHGNYKD